MFALAFLGVRSFWGAFGLFSGSVPGTSLLTSSPEMASPGIVVASIGREVDETGAEEVVAVASVVGSRRVEELI